jgi:hypothetical protein
MANLPLELGKQFASLGATTVYGEQQDLDGVRIIPVALAWSGFGGGEDPNSGGAGGGGGGVVIPIGAYIRVGDDVRFEPNLVSLLAVGVPFVWVAGKALSRIIRALKR